jgi:hypothetical protein
MSTPNLSPEMAKQASVMLRKQAAYIEQLEKNAASMQAEHAKLLRERECLKIAHQLSEIGRIPKDFASITERAEKLAASDKDLSVIKEAIDLAQLDFGLGTVAHSKPGLGAGVDALTAALLESL